MCSTNYLHLNQAQIQLFINLGLGFEGGSEAFFPECLKFESPISVKRAQVGHNVTIGAYSYLVSGFCEDAQIGRYCSIGEEVSIGRKSKDINLFSTSPFFFGTKVVNGYNEPRHLQTLSRLYTSNREIIEEESNRHSAEITRIGHDVWIGHNVFIKPGVTIGNGAVIGAHSVVTRDVPAYAVSVGSPSKTIKFRFAKEVREELENSAWWDFDLEYLSELKIDMKNPSSMLKLLQNQSMKRRRYSLTNVGLVYRMLLTDGYLSDSPNARIIADKFFRQNNFSEARSYYETSLAMNEANLHYTLNNYSNLKLAEGDLMGSVELNLQALSLSDVDLDYCKMSIRNSIPQLITRLDGLELREILQKLGFRFKGGHNPGKGTLSTLIIGFPRCGSTAMFNKLIADGATAGPVSECLINLPSLEETIDNYLKILQVEENSDREEERELVDKSTAFSLCYPLLQAIKSKIPELRVISLVRDPINRSLSAYRMDELNTSNLMDTMKIEIDLILKFGGYKEIFFNYSSFYNFILTLSSKGINFPVLYPTFIMLRRKDLFTEHLDFETELTISESQVNPANSSEYRLVSEEEIQVLQSYLFDLEKYA